PVSRDLHSPSFRCGSTCGVAAIYWQGYAKHEASAGAAEPEDGRGHLAGSAEACDRLAGDGFLHVELASGQHVSDHRGLDRPRADRVDPDTPRCVLQGSALR